MRTIAQLLLVLLLIGVIRAYMAGGWGGAGSFMRAKVVGT